MKKAYIYILLISHFIALNIHAQSKDEESKDGRYWAEQHLKRVLADSQLPNAHINHSLILKDSITAINVVEPILFSTFGKDDIIGERPYSIYFIDHYWVISGTLFHPKDKPGEITVVFGGVFSIIIDAFDCRVIELRHGK